MPINIKSIVMEPLSAAARLLAAINGTYTIEGVGTWSYDSFDGHSYGPFMEDRWPSKEDDLEVLAQSVCQDIEAQASELLAWASESAGHGVHTPWLQQAGKLAELSQLHQQISRLFNFFE